MSTMRTWKVKYSGKLDILIFSYVVVLIVYSLFYFKAAIKEGGDLFENFWMGLLLLFPITIGIISVTLSMVRKKKVPRSILINPDNKLLEIEFFAVVKNPPMTLELQEISFQFIESSTFTVLVLYKKETATRGHTLHFEICSIFSMPFSTSWNQRNVYEIINVLKDQQVELHIPAKGKHISDYILG